MKYFNTLMQGTLIAADFFSDTFVNPSVGVVPSYQDTPLATGLATKSGNTIRLLIINKELSQTSNVQLDIAGTAKPSEIGFSFVTSTNPLASGNASDVITEYSGTLPVSPLPVAFQMPPHSIALLTIQLSF